MGIYPTLALNLQQPLLDAAFPLLENAEVAALEWSFDTVDAIPAWFEDLLLAYAQEQRLIGHGVFFSIFTGRWLPEQAAWLAWLEQHQDHYRFDHITEHFGFMTGADFHKGAPMSLPLNAQTLRIGTDRLARIQAAARCPVGLENLAFAFSLEDVQRHGEFLDALLTPIDGFIILDLHNLYCQIHNFAVDAEALLLSYPLHRVREIHISGGSWETAADNKKIRRDTHDDAVPEAVFDLLAKALPLCPNLKYVTLEQMGNSLHSPEAKDGFRADFRRMAAIVNAFEAHPSMKTTPAHFLPSLPSPTQPPPEDEWLYAQQRALARILETATSPQGAHTALACSILAHSDWQVERWDTNMLRTAMGIAQKWQ